MEKPFLIVRANSGQLEKLGGKARACEADFSTEEGCRKVSDRVASETDRLDVLVNNAGGPLFSGSARNAALIAYYSAAKGPSTSMAACSCDDFNTTAKDNALSETRQLKAYYGDLHTHCGISYGRGTIEETLTNARKCLDFCSVTGHGHWPDIPEANERTQPIVDFHQRGFARLQEQWPHVQEVTRSFCEDGVFVPFLGFEIHSCADGDYTVVYKDGEGDILRLSIPELKDKISQLRRDGIEILAFPHHIAYRRGYRGINWDTFSEEHFPVVEIISMQGCSETDESSRPFLGAMGPTDWECTMQAGLQRGHVFGVVGNTDHNFAHPGSHGHGLTGLWAPELTRDAVWDAIKARRTYALTGDRIALAFDINGHPMGSVLPPVDKRNIAVDISAGGAIDYVDIVKNNRLLRRFSQCDFPQESPGDVIRTKLYLELGWGHFYDIRQWDVDFGISEGRIIGIEPRFCQPSIVNALEDRCEGKQYLDSHWEAIHEQNVHFDTQTRGNPNYWTRITQGMVLEVEMPRSAEVLLSINGTPERVPLARLLQGAKTGSDIQQLESPAWRLHRVPLACEYRWNIAFEDNAAEPPQSESERDFYYVRVRQTNDQWAWSSPIHIGCR